VIKVEASSSNQDKGKKNVKNQKSEQDVLITESLEENLEPLMKIFSYPINEDFILREIYIRSLKRNAALLYMDGMVDMKSVQRHIMGPLINDEFHVEVEDKLQSIMKTILVAKKLKTINKIKNIVEEIVLGNTVLIIEGYDTAIAIDSTSYEHRAIEKPSLEGSIKGPKEAFSESEQTNRSLIRKQIKNENLVTEVISVGEEVVTKVRVIYVKNIANPELVEKVKKRIKEIQVDFLQNVEALEQHIEDRPYSLVPTVLTTERPDRAAAFLMEGHVGILVDGGPACAIVPVTFWGLFHTPEDHYIRVPYANFIRMIRLFSIAVALLAPAIYIGMTNYHFEMVPTDLLMAIAATRERVPFPVILEILLMELAFELIREAGIRVPLVIGPTIGIVGALILGQAAVQANIVSPILVIVVALTGLSSYAIPDFNIGFMIRIMRFIFLIVSAILGFYAVAVLLVMCIAYLVSVKSFDVPFFAPFAPHYKSSTDVIFIAPIWKQWLRPFHINPQKKVRRKPAKGGKLGDQ
jgi:spore germination protein KA